MCHYYYYYYYFVVGKTIAGTTDSPTEVTHYPSPTEEDIRFILQEVKDYLSPDLSGLSIKNIEKLMYINLVRRGDVLAAWSGIRPLVSDPNSKDTQSISRNHVIEVSKSKMVTIAGGKSHDNHMKVTHLLLQVNGPLTVLCLVIQLIKL